LAFSLILSVAVAGGRDAALFGLFEFVVSRRAGAVGWLRCRHRLLEITAAGVA